MPAAPVAKGGGRRARWSGTGALITRGTINSCVPPQHAHVYDCVTVSVYCMSSSAQSLSIPIVMQRAHICISQASLHASFLSSLMGSRSRAPYVYLKSRRRVRDHGQRTDAHDSPHSARLCGASCGCLGFLPGGHAISVCVYSPLLIKVA